MRTHTVEAWLRRECLLPSTAKGQGLFHTDLAASNACPQYPEAE